MPTYIDETEVYRATDEGRLVFEHYFPGKDFNDRRLFLKDRPEEKTASTRVSYYQGKWRITDFGNPEVNGLTAVAYVMYKEHLVFYDALRWILSVVLHRSSDDSSNGTFKSSQWEPGYSYRELTPEDMPGEPKFTYKEPSTLDLSAIGPFVTAEHLKLFCCRVVDQYEEVGKSKKLNKDVVHVWKSTEDYPIFLFDYGNFKKLYQPHNKDKKYRFRYFGNKDKNCVYGLPQVRRAKNEFVDDEDEFLPKDKPNAVVKDLFRVSGESDALNMASLGYHVYWLNSESAGYNGKYEEIDDLCENHYQILDLDPTGMAMAKKNALEHINMFTMSLPSWLSFKKDFRGNPCKDIKDFIAQFSNVDDARNNVNKFKCKARKIKFWHKNEDKYELNSEHYVFFLKMCGFHRFRYGHIKNFDFCYVQIKDNIVELIPPDQIKRKMRMFTREWIISKNLYDEIKILNKLNNSVQVSENVLDSFDDIDLNFTNCSDKEEYLHFKNCSLRITPDAITRIKHTEVPNYILGDVTIKGQKLSQIIDFQLSFQPKNDIEITPKGRFADILESLKEKNDLKLKAEMDSIPEAQRYDIKIADNRFVFASFIHDLSRLHWRKELEDESPLSDEEKMSEKLNLINIVYALGYMSAQFKHQAKAWLVYLQDTKESAVGESSGRSGKSLLTKALTYVRNSFYIGGRELEDQSKYQFLYDGYTDFHDIIEVDDLAERANFDFFYTQITGNRCVNSKNTSPFVLDYENSGKMIISTNFEMPNSSSSTIARMLNVGVSDFYHQKTTSNDYKETRSPFDVYGKMIFKDFTDEEWNKFYYFMAFCIQTYLRFPRISAPMESLERRQMRKIMSSGLGRGDIFLEWANDYFCHWTGEPVHRPIYSTEQDDDITSDVYMDSFFNKKAAFRHFKENAGVPDSKLRNMSVPSFINKLDEWCNYNGYTLNPIEACTDKSRQRIRKRIGLTGDLKEFFYIKTTSDFVFPEPTTTPAINIDPLIDDDKLFT